MLSSEKGILAAVGNTPMALLETNHFTFWAKLEGMNPFGSMKDRAVSFLLSTLLREGTIRPDTTIIESSSGNFAIALSAVCNTLKLRCICVVDPNITKTNRQILEQFGTQLILVDYPTEDNSFQKRRIEIVKEYLAAHENVYWTNQYDNTLLQQAYYPLASEIIVQCPDAEIIFVPISTCGTIAGISAWIKQHRPKVKVVAVDSGDSNIFGSSIGKGHFPGMGSDIIPGNLQSAFIDDVVIVSDYECLIGCRTLMKQGVFAGVSSGGVTTAITKYSNAHSVTVGIFPDRGDRYLDSLYNDEWYQRNLPQLLQDNLLLSGVDDIVSRIIFFDKC